MRLSEIWLILSMIVLATGYSWVKLGDLGIVLALVLVLIVWWEKRKLRIPPSYFLYLLFVTYMGGQILLTGNPFESPKFFGLAIAFGAVWISTYNMMVDPAKWAKFLLGSGLLFALLGSFYHVYENLLGASVKYGVIGPYSKNHHHLGVWWGLVVVAVIDLWRRKEITRLARDLLLGLAVVVVVVSQARSAIVVAAVGMAYYLWKTRLTDKKKLFSGLAGLVTLAMVMGAGKSWSAWITYVRQGLAAYVKAPGGYGVGNYLMASTRTMWVSGTDDYLTSLAHNLPVEMLVGLGHWGWVYIIWLVYATYTAVKTRGETLFVSIYLAILASMMVDVTYVLPVFVWSWGVSIGMSQIRVKREV